ncbi:hypothetical protein MCOR34_008408 [Pyricularia oryzae]|uniref:Tryptophan synthase beta chain-like PALP domain-containing protein n=1 Tax=Pyricularia oryzae TaxID=318829 RepID=A0A4P7N999_PYROR|nr:hypothetical protein MCOR34_008408 [Pyricularia oryzae]KAI6570730.1 hypothetical protein MCOR04_008015 [Pyricularia oryzae]QBZ59079.1 hypothetical protein PoMZ_04039 [Pyricularia oryzae]
MADSVTSPPLERASIFAAHELIKPYVHRTPVLTNATLTALASTPRTAEDLRGTRWADRADRPARPVLRLWFKCENFQRIGAFKPRGAFHAVERLKLIPGWLEGQGRTNGVVTASSGNHAQALALAARTAGIPAHIVIPSIAPAPKLAATKALGATIYRSGSTGAEREAVAAKVVADTGGRYIPPYDHPDIILGQGTLGLEMQEQVEALMAGGDAAATGGDFTRRGQTSGTQGQAGGQKKGLNAIIAPCGGGGMLSGVALSCEGTGIRVFGAEPEFQGADECKRSFEAGKRIDTVKSLTIADGLRTAVGKYPWSIIYERRLVSQMFNVTEDEIKDALRLILERFKLVVEPSAAVPVAVALFNEDFRAMVETEAGENGWDLGIVLSGGNVSLEMLGKLFPEGLPA